MTATHESSEGLRNLLVRLRYSGPDGWEREEEATDLMSYCTRKYGALARRHHAEPEDAAAAAFEVMRTRTIRVAEDPWAVVTRAVQVTLIAEERANGLLCSTTRARRPEVAANHDAERFSDRETTITDYHPAFQVAANQDQVELTPEPPQPQPTNAFMALDVAVVIFDALGWPKKTAGVLLDYIAARLIESGTRTAAYEMLRRDHHARALFDLTRSSWASILRVTLGNQGADYEYTTEGRGLLLRLMIGETLEELLADDALVRDISAAVPPKARRELTELLADLLSAEGMEPLDPEFIELLTDILAAEDTESLDPLLAKELTEELADESGMVRIDD